MKREYEKLKKLHNKYLSREKHKVSSEMEDSLADIKRLNGKLEVDQCHAFGQQWEETLQIDVLVQERRNSSALAMELCLSCTNTSR